MLKQSKQIVQPKPFLKWVGGKRQLLPELISRLPKHYSTYYEPFIGGGALFFHIQPKIAYLSDLNSELINTYQVVKNELPELIQELRQHPHNEEYFYKLRNADRTEDFSDWSSVKKASRFIFLNRTCFNGLYRVNLRGYFNVPFGKYANPMICDVENLMACSAALQQTNLSVGSYLNIEDTIRPNDFVYFDPPYAPVNETSNFTGYCSGGFSSKMQEELRDFCLRLDSRGIKFMASNSDVSSIRELYSSFHIEKVFASRSINSKGNKRGKISEVIIRNYH